MGFGIEDNQIMTETIISTFKSLDKLEEQLKYCLVLLYQLTEDQQNVFNEQIVEFEGYFADINFMREVRHRDAMVKDYSAEYFGKDYGFDDPFQFNPKLEKKINIISMRIMATLGLLIKQIKEQHINISDEA